MTRPTRTTFICLLITVCGSLPTAAQQPPLVGLVDFNDAAAGEIIAPNRYQSQGILLSTNPGHHLYTVQRDGPHGYYRSSLAVSPGGDEDLYIEVTFVVPGTTEPGRVQRTEIQALDAAVLGYRYHYYDAHGSSANHGSGRRDNVIDVGSYRDDPVAHRFRLIFNAQTGQYLDNIRFSHIVPVDKQKNSVARCRR